MGPELTPLEADRIAMSHAQRVVERLRQTSGQPLAAQGVDLSAVMESQCFYHMRLPVRSGNLLAALADSLRALRKKHVRLLLRQITHAIRAAPLRPPGPTVVIVPTHSRHFDSLAGFVALAEKAGLRVEYSVWPGVNPSGPKGSLRSHLLTEFTTTLDSWMLEKERLRLARVARTTDLHEFLGQAEWAEWVGLLWAEAVHLVTTLRRMVRYHEARVLVLMQDQTPLGQAAAIAAQAESARSLNIQHGVIQPGVWSARMAYDRMACFGDSYRETLLQAGISDQKVVVTGAPHYDHLFEVQDRLAVRSRLGLDSESTVILFASQWGHINHPDSLRRSILNAVCQAVQAIPGALLIVKKHPLERDNLCEEVCAEAYSRSSSGYLVVGDEPLTLLLAAADVVVTRHSTVGHEAACVNLPVLTVNLSGGPGETPYADQGIGLEASSPQEVLEHLVTLLDRDVRSRMAVRFAEFRRRWCQPEGGRAGDRLVQVLLDLYSP